MEYKNIVITYKQTIYTIDNISQKKKKLLISSFGFT